MDNTATLCAAIFEANRQRDDLHQAERRLTQQIKSICRRLAKGNATEGEKIYASISSDGPNSLCNIARTVTEELRHARSAIQAGRTRIECHMVACAKRLPIWPRVEATPGLGALSLACLVGETGDLDNYPTHSKLWKRLGLAVIDGQCQQRLGGADAIRQGYSPGRRSLVWKIGSNMLRLQSAHASNSRRRLPKPAGPFRLGYDARKAYELANGLPQAHAHNRAKRYMEKKLVRNIWRAWREAGPALAPALAPT